MLKDILEQKVLQNLGTTKEGFQSWKTKSYPADSFVMEQFKQIVDKSDQVHILGDYDCDGVCATYIMHHLINRHFYKPCDFLIPHRFSDGFGIKSSLVDRLYEKDKEDLANGKKITIVTVDNGIAGYEAVEHAKSLGYDVIITDHHEQGDNKTPPANLVIDPKAPGCNPFSYDGYCGAGVAYKIAEYFIHTQGVLDSLKPFAALATVADVMPLKEENHVIVSTAIKDLQSGKVPKSLDFLAKACEFDWAYLTEKDFGFLFGPIVNASGRLYDDGATRVENYLMSPNLETASQLVANNNTRKDLAKEFQSVIMNQVESQELYKKSPMWVYQPGIPEGIVGILAGKLTEAYGVPTIVVTDCENEEGLKGSGRSTSNFHLYDYLVHTRTMDILQAAESADIITHLHGVYQLNGISIDGIGVYESLDAMAQDMISKTTSDYQPVDILKESMPEYVDKFIGFGGHAGAAGLTVRKSQWEYFQNLPNLDIHEQENLSQPDVMIAPEEMKEAWDILREYAPFGEGNPEVLFEIPINRGSDSIRMVGQDGNTMMMNGDDYKIVCFRHSQATQGIDTSGVYDVIGPLSISVWRGKATVQLTTDELADYTKEKDIRGVIEEQRQGHEYY